MEGDQTLRTHHSGEEHTRLDSGLDWADSQISGPTPARLGSEVGRRVIEL